MNLNLNQGARPDQLTRARAATGELPPLTDASQATFESALNAERSRVPALDVVALRARAHRLTDPVVEPERAWWRRALSRLGAPLLLVPALGAAAALILLSPGEPGPNRLKGDHDLGFYVLRDSRVLPGDPTATFHEGDRLQFTYRTPASGLILLSIDGEGQLSVYHPEHGEAPVPVVPGERHVLDGAIELDDAPGPEVFLGFFGAWTRSEAGEVALEAWNEGGAAGLAALDASSPEIVSLSLRKD